MEYSHINQITEQEIKKLVEEKTPERRHLEYKREINFSSDPEKTDLLADVCSFANSGGGIIIYGIEEEKDENNKNSGLPKNITGLKINTDETIRSLNESIRKSIEPALMDVRIDLRKIDDKTVIVLFVPQSPLFPHRVKFKNKNRFYKRADANRYEIPIEELRKDFLGGAELFKRISEFKSERITKILSNDTSIILQKYPKLVLHIIPVYYFDNIQAFRNFSQFETTEFKPIGLFGISTPLSSSRLNFDGYVTYFSAKNEPAYSYTQIFRNAVIEAVDMDKITSDLDFKTRGIRLHKSNLKRSYEKYVIKALNLYCSSLIKKSINGPCVVFLSLLGIKGYKMYKDPQSTSLLDQEEVPIDRENLLLPDMYIKDIKSFSAPKIMKPAFDMVWNACGYPGSKNYDQTGKRNPS